jgi:hypothetical protein
MASLATLVPCRTNKIMRLDDGMGRDDAAAAAAVVVAAVVNATAATIVMMMLREME